ncbi:MAG: hypothetical protein AAF843_11210 [Bacteroidota bacterium]
MNYSISLLFCATLFLAVQSCKTAKREDLPDIDSRLSQYFEGKSFKKLWNTSKTVVIGVHEEVRKKRIPGLPITSKVVVMKVKDNDWIYERTLQDGSVSWYDDFTIKIIDYTGRVDQPEIKNDYILFDVRTKKIFQPTENKL